MVKPHGGILCNYKKEMNLISEQIHSDFLDILNEQRKIQKYTCHNFCDFFFLKPYPVLYLLALESGRGVCVLGWRIGQHLMGLFPFLRTASSECPYGPLKPRVANRTTVHWTCILWPAASYSCQMVWKTSPVSCYSTSRTNGWLLISLWKWKVGFCFSKIVITILCTL